jgi:allantoicase
VDEEGIDEGGITKEWFAIIVEDLLNPKYGLCHPNPFAAHGMWYTHFNPVLIPRD